MSQTPINDRLSLAQATAHAQHMKLLVGDDVATDWTFAGSLRRQRESIVDIEHVLIPIIDDIEVEKSVGLFSQSVLLKDQNWLWHRLDELLAGGKIAKAHNAGGQTCWGEHKRSASLDGITHEFNLATPDNLGARLAIHTGPAELSKHLVTVIKQAGYRCEGGFHVYPVNNGTRISVPDEETFFGICRVKFVAPQDRDMLWHSIELAERQTRRGSLR